MCNISCIIFGAVNILREEISGKSVLDVGSYNYNGNFHDFLKYYKPKKFIGTDMIPGPGVDVVCKGEDILTRFGPNSFDVVLSSELMEHARNWREIISNIKNVCKPGGLIVITTRSFGFGLHAYPYDYWRYEEDDMRRIFSDCSILALAKDPIAPGVFIKVQKPLNFKENDLSNIELYSMVHQRRIRNLDPEKEKRFLSKYNRRKRIVAMKDAFDRKVATLLHKLARFDSKV
ncbi:MAG: methyltransferase domain-containing protein [Patescibacteria group bacterium]|nr:methyltransferase domain-containing protein [Patescibacteria group bacterium]